MKKIITIVLCLSILLSSVVSAYAATATCKSGEGKGTSYYATVSMGKKTGYYVYLSVSLTGTYRPDKNSSTYTRKDSQSSGGGDNESYSVTARVTAKADNHLRVKHVVNGYSGEYRHN